MTNDLGHPKPKNNSDVDIFRKLTKNYLKNPYKQILVVEFDNVRIVGMVSLMFLPRLNQTHTELYIPELIVLDEYQGQGVDKKLIESCISLTKRKNCHRIRLESSNPREQSHKFYGHLRFIQSAFSFTKNLD